MLLLRCPVTDPPSSPRLLVRLQLTSGSALLPIAVLNLSRASGASQSLPNDDCRLNPLLLYGLHGPAPGDPIPQLRCDENQLGDTS